MRRLLIVALVLVATSAPAADRFEQITVAAAAIGLTTAQIDPPGIPQAQIATCRLRTAQVSFTYDGTVPTASVGTLLEVGEVLILTGHERLQAFRAIRTTGTSGQLDCSYTP